jgi:hypothetical protein
MWVKSEVPARIDLFYRALRNTLIVPLAPDSRKLNPSIERWFKEHVQQDPSLLCFILRSATLQEISMQLFKVFVTLPATLASNNQIPASSEIPFEVHPLVKYLCIVQSTHCDNLHHQYTLFPISDQHVHTIRTLVYPAVNRAQDSQKFDTLLTQVLTVGDLSIWALHAADLLGSLQLSDVPAVLMRAFVFAADLHFPLIARLNLLATTTDSASNCSA